MNDEERIPVCISNSILSNGDKVSYGGFDMSNELERLTVKLSSFLIKNIEKDRSECYITKLVMANTNTYPTIYDF